MTIQPSPPSTSLRAMTLNLFGHNGAWPARRPVLQAGLAQLRRRHRRGGTRAARRLLVGCHGNSWAWWAEHERELQVLAVVRRIEELVAGDPAHVIVGGDFNATPDTSSMRFWTGRRSLDGTSTAHRDCWESIHGGDPGLTFEPRNP